jgi:MSHA biogenesis protein MshI
MFSFKKKSRGDRLGALIVGTEELLTARVHQSKTGKPVLEGTGFYPQSPGQDQESRLKKVVIEQGLNKIPCSTLLGIGEYQLLMVEAPEVPAAELKAAIRWRIRDLIDFHIDDAVLDVFDVPPSGARGVQEHLYVVVARSALVKERVEALQAAGTDLEVIDIPELALRNLAAQLEQDANGQAMLYFGAEQGLITLTRDATLYLARSMDIGYQHLQASPDLVDRLALELQRSMDYYDRHFQQAPITHVTICPLPQSVPHFAERLAQQTGITVHELHLNDVVEVSTPVDDAQFARCLLAIGAALRSEPAQL